MMLQMNPNCDQLNRLSGYYAAQVITKEWMQPTNKTHDVFPASIEQHGSRSALSVSIYALQRPDKQWAILAINKNPKRSVRLEVKFKLAGNSVTFAGKVDVVQFSSQQYAWHDDAQNGHPIRSMPPARFTQKASSFYDLPPYSLTVLRGKLAE